MLFVSYLWFLVDPISFNQMVVRLFFACFLPILSCLYRDRSLETLKLRTQRTSAFHTCLTRNVVSLTFRPSRIATASFKAFIVSDCQWYDLETMTAMTSCLVGCLYLDPMRVDSSFAARSIGRIPLHSYSELWGRSDCFHLPRPMQ